MCLKIGVYKCASLSICVCIHMHVCWNIFEQRFAPLNRVTGKEGLPHILSVIQSGVALLAIICPVRSLAMVPPHHISLCQFAHCLRTQPWSTKLHATVIITVSDISRFSPLHHQQMSPFILRPWLIKYLNYFH